MVKRAIHEVDGVVRVTVRDGRDLERARTDPRDTEGAHARSDRVHTRPVAEFDQVTRDAWGPLGALRGPMRRDDRLVSFTASLLAHQRLPALGPLPAVVARHRDLQEPGHASDLKVRALRGHQRKSLCFGGFEAKYAAAFPNYGEFSISGIMRKPGLCGNGPGSPLFDADRTEVFRIIRGRRAWPAGSRMVDSGRELCRSGWCGRGLVP